MRALSIATKGWIQSRGIEVATRGIVSRLGAYIIEAEILRFTSTFTKLIDKISSFQREMDGV